MTDGSVTFVTGRRGSGKTTWIKNHVARLSRVLVWDWRGEYSFPPISTPKILEMFRSQTFQFTYRPDYTADLPEQFNVLAYCILHMQAAQNFTLIVDEAYMVCPQNSEGELGKMIRLTRPKNINLIVSSQRPCLVPGVFRSESDQFIIFHLHNPADVYLIRSIFGEHAAEKVSHLHKFQYLNLSH